MNGTIKHILYMAAALLTLCFCGCADEAVVDTKPQKEGTLLNMYVSTTPTTRLAELGSPNNMNDTKENKYEHKDVGLYIYYEDDYKAGDLSKPYIRNLRCTVQGNQLVANEEIYIYDRMTIVAFYPYNEAMSDEANYFTTKQDEKAYPITESDYSKQYYIPYRAKTEVNPTNAYKITLGFSPQQTCKVEVVLVADSKDDFPTSPVDFKNDEAIKLLPTIDRYTDGTNEWKSDKGDLRENWVDGIEDFPSDERTPLVGGKYVRRYTAYVWKSGENDPHHDKDHKHHDNILKAGEQLFVSDKLILTVPYTVNLNEQIVYRYGYNLNTGEIFIPTSDRLVYDATSLKDVSVNSYRVYQVCDIDLSKSDKTWTPKTAFKGTYDGGGHKIMNLTINTKAADAGKDPVKQSFGLFESISSESTLMNIDLVNPNITVDFSTNKKDTCYVGALCGLINPELTDEEKRKMLGNGLPPELSETVKKALIEDMLAEFDNSSTCYIRGCKVTNPIINVTGENVRVGGLCGGAGNQKQKAEIKDSYVWQDSETNNSGDAIGIAVNTKDEDQKKYTAAYAAGFCGIVSNGSIKNCYTTMEKVHAYVKEETPASGNNPVVTTAKDVAQGFYNSAPKKEKVNVSVSGCYTMKEDTNEGVGNLKNAWPSDWPLFDDDSTVSNGGNVNYPGAYPAYTWTDSWHGMGTEGSIYPTLVWEHPLIKKL